MPVHGLKADLELLGLVASAAIASYLVHGAVLSNIMFTVLLGGLFFLLGLHIDLDLEGALNHRLDTLTVIALMVFAVTPLIAYSFSFLGATEAFLVLAASATAIGSPRVWSNFAGADGRLAGVGGSISILLSFLLAPVIFAIVYPQADLQMLSLNAAKFALPFLAGVSLRNYENFVIDDLRIHFSKMSFWLITTITLIQFGFLYEAGALNLGLILGSAVLFSLFTIVSYCLGFAISELVGFYPKESVAIGYISGTKNVAIAFLLASQINGQTIALVGLYYFTRQLTGIGITKALKRYDVTKVIG